MTDPIIIDAGVVGFSEDERTVTGMLLPFGEECRSSVGRFTFSDDAVTVPEDVPGVVGFNREHDRAQPIGRATMLTHTPQGIIGTFKLATGPEGDSALEDIKSGKRRHLSAEVTGLRIKEGRGIAARIFGAALVEKPAFPSAALFAAADTDDSAPDTVESDDAAEEHTETTTDAPAPEDTEPAAPANPEEDAVDAATATGFAAAQPADVEKAVVTIDGFFAAIEEAKASGDHSKLEQLQGIQRMAMFALQDVTYETGTRSLGTSDVIVKKDYVGELWQGNQQERRYIPLFQQAALKALEWRGWKWTVKPAVAKWAGNKSEIPSTKPEVTPTNGKAQRFAGGNDIAREFYDFNETEAIQAYVKALVESYALVSDLYVLETVKAAATALTIAAGDTAPTGVNDAHYKIVRGALAVIAARATPTFAIVAQDVFAELALTPKDKTLEFLSLSVGLEGGSLEGFRIVPSPDLAAGEVLVGASRAVRVLELPGSPIRVNALDIVKGGIDEAVFGYVGVDVQYPAALQLVTRAAA